MTSDDRPRAGARRAFLAGLAVTAGGGFVASTASADSPLERYDVRSFGAVGDGRTDDSDAIQRAIDHGTEQDHPVLVSPGNYRVTRTLRLRSQVDLFGLDASFCSLLHDLRGQTAPERSRNATLLRVEGEGTTSTKDVTLHNLRLRTTEPRADLGDDTPQLGIRVRRGYWNFKLIDCIVQDFALGVHLSECWTARMVRCSIERSFACLRWENATAGEITSSRLDCISGSEVTGRGGDCAYVSHDSAPPFHETLALSVSNSSFQNAELAGFRGVGLGSVVFSNNFLEGNNRTGASAVIRLEAATAPAPGVPARSLRVLNLNGGFMTPGAHGQGPAVSVANYAVINVIGLDVRGANLGRGLHLYGVDSRVNIIGAHVEGLPNFVRSSRLKVEGSVFPLSPTSARPA